MSKDETSRDFTKIEVVTKWDRSITVTIVCSFLRLAGYYQQFVQDFVIIVSPLTQLTKKGVPFIWNDECEKSLQDLKQRLVSALILTMLESSEGYVIYIGR